MLKVSIQALIDTGAKLSCISEQLLHCNELFKSLKIRKCDRRAYGVNGEPVVTLGLVDVEFKIGGLVFTHTFTILRGLIHPMLLGMDFLVRYKAMINLGGQPCLRLAHPLGPHATTPFIRAMPPKQKSSSYIALLKEIEIPASSSYYANAYIANIDSIQSLIDEKPSRLLGITACQKVNDFFDPGFVLRDAVINADKEAFKIELLNPWEHPLKVAEETPVGAIFDFDCEIIESDDVEQNFWENEPADASDAFLRKQAMLAANICVVEEAEQKEQEEEEKEEWKEEPPDQLFNPIPKGKTAKVTTKDQQAGEKGQLFNPIQKGKTAKVPSPSEHHQDSPTVPKSAISHGNEDHRQKTPSCQPLHWLAGKVKKKENEYTLAYTDEPEGQVRYSDKHGEKALPEEKTFLVDMEDAEYEEGHRERLEAVLETNFEALASDPRDAGCTDVICHRVKIDNPRPVYLSYHRAQGSDIRKEVDKQTNGMLADGIIVESESPYCSPIVMVKKKSGEWRYCVDLRKINSMTEKVSFPMPRIEDALRKLKKPKYFSSMDLLKAYYQIPVAEEDQRYYAFSDGRRHLQFTRCPMGAKNSGSTLALLMELVLRGLPPECVIGYLDDILLATEDFDTHMVLLDRLLKALIRAKLKLCPSKCQFARKETKTLGYRLSAEGIKPDAFNLDKVKKWSECKNVGEVRTFLGLTGYYRSLIKGYADIAAPLTDLLHKDCEWRWSEREKKAFFTLRDLLVSEPIAAYPDYEKEFLLKTDASKVALGAVLAQEQEKRERMIACMSKKFTEDELKWATYDREFLAMILPTRHFSHYLRWNHFKLFTDHKPLLSWKDVSTVKDASGKRVRWVMELSTYDVEVIYKEGKRHGDADALSRHPNPDEEREEEKEFLSAITEKEQSEPIGEGPEREEMDLWRESLVHDRDREAKMARELSKFQTTVMYRETGKNAHITPNLMANNDEENVICSLTTKSSMWQETEVELYFLAADTMTEIALVEIHSDDELGQEIAREQAADEDLAQVRRMVKEDVKDLKEWKCVPNWFRQNRDKFVLCKDVLYHVKQVESFPEPVARMVIPKARIPEMLFRCHGCKHSGHPGVNRAIARLEKFVTWQGMVKDITQHVNRCAECQAARMEVPRKVAPIKPQAALAPLQFIQADLFKTGASYKGYNYVCVFEDRFTKLCKLYPLKDTKAKGVAQCVESFVTQLGCPDVWGTDGGPEFYNVLIVALCHVLNIKKEFALAFRPQTQGQTERKNRTIKAELRKRIAQFGKAWPSYLKWIEMAYNTTPHASHGYTPFLMMFGREAKLPMQTNLAKFDTKGWQTTMKDYLGDFLDRLAIFHEQAMANQALYQMKMSQQHDKKLFEAMQPGQQVLRYVPSQFRTKLDLPKDGPWTVQEQREKEGVKLPVYKITNELNKTILTHRENLSPFQEPNFAENLAKTQTEPEERPKSASKTKAKSKAGSPDGPANRTRSKSKFIMSLFTEPGVAQTAQTAQTAAQAVQIPQAAQAGIYSSEDDDSDDDPSDNAANNRQGVGAASAANSAEQFSPYHSLNTSESYSEEEDRSRDQFNDAQDLISQCSTMQSLHLTSELGEGANPGMGVPEAGESADSAFGLTPNESGLFVSPALIRMAEHRFRLISVRTPPEMNQNPSIVAASEEGEALNAPSMMVLGPSEGEMFADTPGDSSSQPETRRSGRNMDKEKPCYK